MDTKVIKNLIRIGQVSSTNPETMTVKVVFPDQENLVSANLFVVNRGSQSRKDYWIPDIGEQVVCVFLPNASGTGLDEGFVIGSYFSQVDKPIVKDQNIRRIDFGDGSYIEHDRSSGNLRIHAAGEIRVTGTKIHLN